MKDNLSHKPPPGMIQQAQEDLVIDLSRFVVIGDKASDIDAGIPLGAGKSLLFLRSGRPNRLALITENVTALSEALPYLTIGMARSGVQ